MLVYQYNIENGEMNPSFLILKAIIQVLHNSSGENGSRLVKSSQTISARLGIRNPRKTVGFPGVLIQLEKTQQPKK